MTGRRIAAKGASRGGYVLVIVLWLVTLLTVVTMGFHRRARLDRQAAAYALDYAQARIMARGALERGLVELRNKAFNDMLEKDEDFFSTHLGQPWANGENLLERGGGFEYDKSFQGDYAGYIIEDLERWIDINRADEALLEGVPALNRAAIRTIMRRRTEPIREGSQVTPFYNVEELRELSGVSDADYFGSPGYPGLKDLVTTWGDGRINLNTASEEVLSCVPDLEDIAIQAILFYRAGDDGELGTSDDVGFNSLGQLSLKTQITGDSFVALKNFCKTQSNFFKITGIATRRQGAIRASCSVLIRQGRGAMPAIIAWEEQPLGS